MEMKKNLYGPLWIQMEETTKTNCLEVAEARLKQNIQSMYLNEAYEALQQDMQSDQKIWNRMKIESHCNEITCNFNEHAINISWNHIYFALNCNESTFKSNANALDI